MDISPKLPYKIRLASPDDISFIYSSWLKSYRFGSHVGKQTRSMVFFEEYREIIDTILARSSVIVACLEDDPHIILGYVVSEPGIVHYGFIKESFREMGIFNKLLDISQPNKDANIIYTHMTILLHSFINKTSKSHWLYDPFKLYWKHKLE